MCVCVGGVVAEQGECVGGVRGGERDRECVCVGGEGTKRRWLS